MSETPARVGRRIAVWGNTGSGKTTLAQRLGETLGLGVVDLDAIRHASGWDSTPWDEFRETLSRRLDELDAGWVCAGSYSPISDVYLSRADTLIWLHLPFRVSFWRLLRRTVRRARTQQPLYHEGGPRESWRQSFLSRQSILWWAISQHRAGVRKFRQRTGALRGSMDVFELRTASEVEAFLETMAGQASANADTPHTDHLAIG